jgi:FKBP12-rapamycin complex-associated protein
MELGSSKKLSVSETLLKRAWEALQRSTKEDWFEWFKKLSLELLRQSPSHALRACATLASDYLPLSRELFNAAFVSCWTELQDYNQDELIRSIEIALASPKIPNDILQQLLNLAEFMEHDDKTLPIDIGTLGMYASRCHAYAKALHYKELEFISEPTPKIIEDLIGINNQLQQPDAAVGILTYAQRHHQLELQETWYEKLGRWDDALNAYNRKEEEEGVDMTLGKMRCLYNLGEFHQLAPLVEQKWDSFNAKEKEEIAPYATGAIWSFGELSSLSRYTQSIKPDNPDYSFYRAVLALHHSQFDQAQAYIDRTRNILDSELTALIAESYSRAYPIIVQVQMLSELEEVIQYKLFADQPDRQETLRKTWIKRYFKPDLSFTYTKL